MSVPQLTLRPYHRPIRLLDMQSAILSRRASLSTSRENRSQNLLLQKPGSNGPTPPNPSYPTFSFQDLGANRTVKVIVIVCLTVFGTLESIFWAKFLWAKFSPSPENESQPEAK